MTGQTRHLTNRHRGMGPQTFECNTPTAVAGATWTSQTWDTYYDIDQNTTTLDPLFGLTTANDADYTLIENVLMLIRIQVAIKASPGHAGTVALFSGDYLDNWSVDVTHPNTLGTIIETLVLALPNTSSLRLRVNGTTGDFLIDYAVMNVIRIG